MKPILTPSTEHLDLDGLTFSDHPQNGCKTFPDGELYTQIKGLEDLEEAVVIHSGMPKPNEGLIFLYGALELLKQKNISTEVVFTYFPYGMQDQEFYENDLNHAESITRKLTNYYSVKGIYVLDPHFKDQEWLEKYPVKSFSALDLIEKELDQGFKLLGPDKGAGEYFGIDNVEKIRKNSREVEIKGVEDIKEDNIAVIDDIIETGGTMTEITGELQKKKEVSVTGAAVHGVLEEGLEKVDESIDEFYITNSIENKYSNICIEPLIEEIITE